MYTTIATFSRWAHPIIFSRLNTVIYSLYEEVGAVSLKHFRARRIRTDQRWVEGVGAIGGQPESGVKKGRSLLIN
jgi:hypothetical protein